MLHNMKLVDIHSHQALEPDTIGIRNVRYPAKATAEAYSIGIHPWDADTVAWDNQLEVLANEAVAIGECGIDKACHVPTDIQQSIFEQHIKLAQRLGKPMIIHCVRAYGMMLEISNRYPNHTAWLIHGCYASKEWIRQASQSGNFFFSVGPSQIKMKRFEEVLNAIPRDLLLLETDDSDTKIAEVYKMVNVSEEQIWNNYMRFIGNR